ncbi:MAG: 7-cyano-7-deazaguanine synthase QueC [Altererythrobacter sp.]|nr:7-cyano-7-deazaguanine synthase QueC [Altererythrobacter sp.]MBT8432515.1 7-cyano-7-deazaguanine synthase QueC [Altererythrobacter sp.]NNE50267.1 7-cyano-7-deazaguanine synthase QueC [Altererythrobacter sp.]NNF94352.1 7-cyano-7-deazaguanine synthase QueC [Altererythrobacter sp.]NNK45873.1 7-cyano-7-deazaguanine synthase QueC [Altererythrobacter sp.]
MAEIRQPNHSPAVVLLSGGLDSMVTAALAIEQGFAVHAVTIDYGQRHRRELAAATAIAENLGVERHLRLDLDMRSIGGSALTDEIDVPKSGVGDAIPVTYVPARNLVFLSLCVAAAEAAGSTDVFIGVNALDYSGYPDCRPEFITSFMRTAQLGTKSGVEGGAFTVHAPLQNMTKADIARECNRLGLEPSLSWSCYDPSQAGEACGLCDSCRLRKKGFAEAGLVDSTSYVA